MPEDLTSKAAPPAAETAAEAQTRTGVKPATWAEAEIATMTRPEPVPGAGPLALERGARVDRYTILERVAAGGMGEVYAAFDTKLDRRVALKLLLHGGLEYELRLAREAQAMARLSHPNVVGVFDTGKVNDRLFLAMELVEGQTLRAWTRETPRSGEDVLRAYLEAGRGLAAAHGAGLVHRDFKPDNVLVSREGAVKVTDFGLVRAEAESDRLWLQQKGYVPVGPVTGETSGDVTTHADTTEPTPGEPSSTSGALPVERGSGSLHVPMTEDGALMGTVGYMAPEQYLALPVSAQTDQFSFCVALYDALYGRKPFAGKGVVELANAAMNALVREPPKGHRVPAHIHRVLLRGLRPEREERYPSMQALLDDLVRDPARQRRRLLVGVVGVLAAVGMVVYFERAATARHDRLCAGGESLASEAWNEDGRRAIEQALLATGVPYAADTWARTRDALDAYMGHWSAAYRRTCEATRIDGSQSEQAMTSRMACLEQRRRAVRALTLALKDADASVAAKALPSALDLPEIDACKDVTALGAVEPEPDDPAKRAEIAAIRDDLASVAVSVETGKPGDVAGSAASLVERARGLGYAPLVAETLFWSGSAKVTHDVPTEDALAQWADSAFSADTGRDDALRARAATALMGGLTAAGRFAEAEQWSKVVEATLERAGDPGQKRAAWLEARAALADAQGKDKDSAKLRVEALAIARSGGDLRLVASLERGLALSRARQGDMDAARRLIADADDTMIRLLGETHPDRIAFASARARLQ